MELLYSDIEPLHIEENQLAIIDTAATYLSKSDEAVIAVGYVSVASLEELNAIVKESGLKKITLIMGMYYSEGIAGSIYYTAIKINKEWKKSGIGSIKLVKVFKYHGKAYVFCKGGSPFAAIVGSANLGAIKPEGSNRRQYELAVLSTDHSECCSVKSFVDKLSSSNASADIDAIPRKNLNIIKEINTALVGNELVNEIPSFDAEYYRGELPFQNISGSVPPLKATFKIPLKVPSFENRFLDDGKHFTRSNINVCYCGPRDKRTNKPRDWYEAQFHVPPEIRSSPHYPKKDHPFYILTDDNLLFKAHTTSQGNKQLNAVGDELLIGRWLKGRLATLGLVTPVNDTQKDTSRTGMITQEILDTYGCRELTFAKTRFTRKDEDGNDLDIWLLSFKPHK